MLVFPVSSDDFKFLFVFIPINFEEAAGLDAGEDGDGAFGNSVCGGDFVRNLPSSGWAMRCIQPVGRIFRPARGIGG